MINLFEKFDEICLSGFKLSQKNYLTTPDCGPDLERGYLTCVQDILSHYALSFCEISLYQLQQFISYC